MLLFIRPNTDKNSPKQLADAIAHRVVSVARPRLTPVKSTPNTGAPTRKPHTDEITANRAGYRPPAKINGSLALGEAMMERSRPV